MNTRTGDELTCLVCSDRAMGNNFGAISCESCKAFFRRNAHDIEVSKGKLLPIFTTVNVRKRLFQSN